MQRHPSLHQLLVAPPQQLAPQQPHGQMVAMPHAPPAQLPYGSIPPGIAQSQRFTGGIAQHQPMSQMFSPPDYTPPSYASGGSPPVGQPHPALVSAISALLGLGGHGGGGGGGGQPGGGGGAIGSPFTPPTSHPSTPPAGLPGSQALVPRNPNLTGIGYTPQQNAVSGALSGGGGSYVPRVPVSAGNLAAYGRRGVYNS